MHYLLRRLNNLKSNGKKRRSNNITMRKTERKLKKQQRSKELKRKRKWKYSD
jgi:hypothetical protein